MFLLFVNIVLFAKNNATIVLPKLQIMETLATQQDTVYLSKNFKFHDGIFMTLEDFQNNRPTYTWKEVEAGVFSNPQNFMAQMHFLKVKNKKQKKQKQTILLENIWGICLDGIPYIRLQKEVLNKQNTVFAGLRLRGKICYFEYEEYVMRKIPMPIYNPYTGQPFRTGEIERKVKIIHQNILNFKTGEVAIFSQKNFKKWIQDDPKLLQTVNDLKPNEIDEKLFKILLIYDDRNLVKIRK